MPTHIKLIARYGNGLLTVFFALTSIGLLVKGQVVGFAVLMAFAALGAFNVYVLEKCIRYFSDVELDDRLRELLAAEVRKAELRRELATMAVSLESLPRTSSDTAAHR